MKLLQRESSRISIGLLLALIAAGAWGPDSGRALAQTAPSCATDLTVPCLLTQAKGAAAAIENDLDRWTADHAIARAYARAGLADQALAVLRDPENRRQQATLYGYIFDIRQSLLDVLRETGDEQGTRKVLAFIGQDLEALDHHSLFMLARGWIEVGEMERGLTLLNAALAKEQDKRQACLAKSSNAEVSHCGRATRDATELSFAAAALFAAGRRAEGRRILTTQDPPGWKILTLKKTAERARSASDAELGVWALRRALVLAGDLPDRDTRLLHLGEIHHLARKFGLLDIAETALQRYRLLATAWAESEQSPRPLVRLARVETTAGNTRQARQALRQAFGIAVSLPRAAPSRTESQFGLFSALRDSSPVDGSDSSDLPPLPRNPRREALDHVAWAMETQGFTADLREPLAHLSDEVYVIDHPLHRAKALVTLAGYTRLRDEAAARALLVESKALIDSWPEDTLRRRLREEAARSVRIDFGLSVAEEIFGPAVSDDIRNAGAFGRGLQAVEKGRYAEALRLAERLTSPWERFSVALGTAERLKADPGGAEQDRLRRRAAELVETAVRAAEATQDPKTRADTLASMADTLAARRSDP